MGIERVKEKGEKRMTIDQYKAVFHAVREALLSYSPIYGQYAVTSEEYTKVQDISFAAADKIKSILEDKSNEIL